MAESERVLFCSIDHQKRDHLFGMKATGPLKCGGLRRGAKDLRAPRTFCDVADSPKFSQHQAKAVVGCRIRQLGQTGPLVPTVPEAASHLRD